MNAALPISGADSKRPTYGSSPPPPFSLPSPVHWLSSSLVEPWRGWGTVADPLPLIDGLLFWGRWVWGGVRVAVLGLGDGWISRHPPFPSPHSLSSSSLSEKPGRATTEYISLSLCLTLFCHHSCLLRGWKRESENHFLAPTTKVCYSSI